MDGRALCNFNREHERRMAECPESIEAPVAGMPNLLEMKSLLRDFTESHRPSFQGLLQAKMTLSGGVESLLNEEKLCLVPLKYRPPGPDGLVNPALTFTYQNMAFLPLERTLNDNKYERLREALEASAAVRERMRAQSKSDPHFVGTIPVMFFPQPGAPQLVHFPVYRPMEPTTEAEARTSVEMHTKFIELGIVLREPSPGKAPVPGFMKYLGKGGKWSWRPLFRNDWYSDPEWTTAKDSDARIALLQRKISEGQRT